MNSLRWRLCLLLWFMYTGVECWPKLKLLSRNEDDGPWTLTIGYIVDDSLASLDKDTINTWIQSIKTHTEHVLLNWFHFHIGLHSWIIHYDKVPLLMSWMQSNKNTHFIYLEGAIKTLNNYFKDKKHPDVICLLTNYTISDGGMVTKAHGYSMQQTLCERGVSVLLAYSPGYEGYAGSMLADMIMKSANPQEVPKLHYRQSGYREEMKKYLRKCNGSLVLEEPDIHQPENPPPPAPPSNPEKPAPPEVVPTPTPEATKAPEESTAPPSPPGPPPQPQPKPPVEPSPTTTTTAASQLPEVPSNVPPEEPKESSSTEPVATTTAETPVADYC
uniref:Putative vegetative cell wall protein gp1 n=1 Tax=Ixodes ricinus TaxID=34613 RepID=V5HAC1_IXORI